jgi:hypothetical protein
VAALLVLVVGAAARAEEPPTQPSRRPLFPKGTRTFQTYGGYLNDLGPQDQEGGFVSAGLGYYVFDGVSLSAELTGYGISQPGEDAVAGALGVVLRHHMVEFGDESFFVDVSFAPFEASHRVPQGGTRFNFVTQSGIGWAHGLSRDSNLMLGVRFIHLSNAQLEGNDRNPSINGISAYVGFMWRF